MSLPYGLLGLLSYRDSTGYDLTRMFADSLNHFWHAQSSQIYRELDRMERQGWVASRSVPQEKRPNKRLYSITASGRAALGEWLGDGRPEFAHSHEPMMMRVFFGAENPDVTLRMLRACRDMCERTVDAYHASIEEIIEGYAQDIPDGHARSLYWRMTLEYGTAMTRATAQWAARCIDMMEKGEEA